VRSSQIVSNCKSCYRAINKVQQSGKAPSCQRQTVAAMRRLVFLTFLLLATPALGQENPSSWGQPRSEYLISADKIYVTPDKVISNGQLYVKNGVIQAVGSQVAAPAEARRLDFRDRVIHAAFLDPYVSAERVGLEETSATSVSGAHPGVHDDFLVSDKLETGDDVFRDFRESGFAVVAVAPSQGIFRGQSAIYQTGRSDTSADLILNPRAYSVVAFEEGGWEKLEGENYPLSTMGNAALVRQTFLDTEWYSRWRNKEELGSERPQYQATLESLRTVLSGQRKLWFQSGDLLATLRYLELSKECGLSAPVVVLSGEEWKGLDWFGATAGSGPHVLPLNFPDLELEDGIKESQLTLELLREWYSAPANPRWLKEKGLRFALTSHGLDTPGELDLRVREAVVAGLSPRDALAGLTSEPAALLGLSRHGTLEPGKSASFVVRKGEPFATNSAIQEVWVEGARYPDYQALALEKDPEKEESEPRGFLAESFLETPPGNIPAPFAPTSVLVKGATLWTQDGGTVVGDLLVEGGRIVSVGKPAGRAAHVIDGAGLHVTPGIVDAHSHTAIDGMVNEPGRSVTSMVRVKDVIDPFAHDIYLQLAGGVTVANILHGSANAIGGQSITCKWRYGEPPSGLIMKSAPEGIKFALGENPKQSNWGDAHDSRYPQSRMGVVELIRGSFVSARNYQKLKADGKDPKPDLLLEPLVEVLEKRRLVHCHSYRQDEILALMRTAEEVGFKVDVFQHVLEGYKVADAMVKHGAAASTFADWWAYKVEVEDAIPHNASLMAQAGVLTSINSDSADLARRLNTEAAKSMRYGGLSAEQALDLITKNPAIQLGVGDRIGTLTPGKDADFVLWSDHPLSQNAVVLQTWIDGKRYFERGQEAERVQALKMEREHYLELLKEDE